MEVLALCFSFEISAHLIGVTLDSVLWSPKASKSDLSLKLASAQLDFIKQRIETNTTTSNEGKSEQPKARSIKV